MKPYAIGMFLLVCMVAILTQFSSPVPSAAACWIEPPDDESAPPGDDRHRRDPLAGPKRGDQKQDDAKSRPAGDEPDDEFPPDFRRGRQDRRGRYQEDFERRGRFERDGPRRGRFPRGGPFDGRQAPPPEEMIDQAMKLLSEHAPEWHEKLADLRQRRPERFERIIGRIADELRPVFEMRDQHPELARLVIEDFKVEHRLRQLAQDYASADVTQKRSLDPEIERLVREQVELRMLRRRAQLEVMAQRLERERERLRQDEEKVEALVAQRIEQVKRGGPPERFGEGGEPRERPGRSFGEPPRRGPRGEDEGGPPEDHPRRRRPMEEDPRKPGGI